MLRSARGSPVPPATGTDSVPTNACPESEAGGVLERLIGKKKAKALHRAKAEGADDWKDNSLQLIVKTAQTNTKIAIMNKNLDDCSELVRRYYKARQKAIIDALEFQGN
ncbi:hypothetical protein MJO28_006471 [Puccinia striiformis f. sp. tritici]|uniref:Uncharacterized protein n=1 Tax=Puccinia striiformis f. sp. tritici TaxID=168172 RepID=A0ACC0EHI2_9BASI|nr:hypothetical protein MJO28_006471 [Puccinia striiformis f. sp. tritici]